MAILRDSFGNEIRNLDNLGNEAVIDTRVFLQNINTLNGEVTLDCNSINSAVVDIRGTFVGTFVLEGTINGTDYFQLPTINILTEIFINNITTVGSYIVHLPAACKKLRIRCSAYTSGIANIYLRGNSGDNIIYSKPIPTTSSVTATAAVSTALTLTIPAPGANMFHYITKIIISKYCGVSLTASATPIIVTTTNLATTPSFDFKTLGSLGDSERIALDFTSNPLKSTTNNTATTIVCPVAAGVIWRVNVFYYVGS